ncbi:MAG: DNA polymerase III subunit beta [Clostridiales bacterium]|nr:DNA polymerase III subunit beta [Clostridiales bacterium]
MKFSCERSVLSAAVAIAARAASQRSPIPALEGLLLTADGSLRITGYDLKKGVYTTVPADVSEPGAAVLNAKLLGDMVRCMPEGRLTVTTDGSTARIRCGKSEFSLAAGDVNDYPELPTIDPEDTIMLPQSTLKKMISQTLFAVSDNESRPIYTGARFEIKDGVLTVIAVDGYRLALRREKVESVGEKDLAFIVPGAALADVERLCADTDDVIRVTLGFRHIGFTLGETILITRRLEGDFLNWRKAVPEAFRYHMTLEREELKSAADRVSLVVDERTKNPLRCRFEDGVVTLSCVTALGQAEDACLAEGTGGGLEIGFNSRYLIDALKAAPAQRIVVSISTGSSPCVITPEEGDGFIYMILPVRLRTE